MKTGIEMVQDGFKILNVPAIENIPELTGDIYLYMRPENSEVVDIVLNSLALTNDQLQQGVFNVNIHAPNLSVVINGKTDNTQPDIEAMKVLSKACMQILNDYVGYDFKLYAATTGLPIRDTDGSWYVNIRVNYNSFQNNYSNI